MFVESKNFFTTKKNHWKKGGSSRQLEERGRNMEYTLTSMTAWTSHLRRDAFNFDFVVFLVQLLVLPLEELQLVLKFVENIRPLAFLPLELLVQLGDL